MAQTREEQARVCFKDKWMDNEVPNEPQVVLCKEKIRQKYFQKFDSTIENHRLSSRIKYQDCINEAGNDPVAAVMCMRAFNDGLLKDNVTIEHLFR